MASQLVDTKLFVPSVRGSSVARPRLSRILCRGAEAKLTLVSAPAGFGKTTLLAAWLAPGRRRRSVAWLSLDESDSQPALFWTYVITALQRGGARRRARASWRCCSPRQPPIETVLTTLLNELGAAAGRPRPGPRRLPPRRRPGHRSRAWRSCSSTCRRRCTWCISTPRRPRPAAGPAAGAGRAGRGPRRRPALHARRGRRLPQRGRPASSLTAATSPRWRRAPRAGSPRCSWPRCRCGAAPTSPASSPASPATTGTSSTTWSRRC